MQRAPKTWAIAIFVALGVFGCTATPMMRLGLFPTWVMAPAPEPALPDGAERHWLPTQDGAVEVWFVPGEGVDVAHPGPVVVITHGNAMLIDDLPRRYARYLTMGVSLVLPEYRGYGRTGGQPSADGISADLLRVVAWARARPDVDARRVVYHGYSLGGGFACALARRVPPAALVLESTFTGVDDMAARYGVPALVVADHLPNLATVRELNVPLLVLHGTLDRLIPFAHGEALAAASAQSELVSMTCGHADCPDDPKRFWHAIAGLLVRAGVK